MTKLIKKGVTLLELTIVLALLGIVTTIIVSFSILVKNYTLASTTDEAVLTDFDRVKNVFETWAASVDDSDLEIYVNGNDQLVARSKQSGQEYKLMLITDELSGDHLFAGSYPVSSYRKDITFKAMGQIDSISFELRESSVNGNVLVKLTINYTYYNSTGNQKLTGSRVFMKAMRSAKAYHGGA